MSLRARIECLEDRLNRTSDFLTIYVRGVLDDFIGTDPLDPESNKSPHMGETFDGFVERVRADAIAAGKSQIAIFCGDNSNLKGSTYAK
jgi:hypothetical protein